MKIDPNIGKTASPRAGLSSASVGKPAEAKAVSPGPNTQIQVSGQLQALEVQMSSNSFDSRKVEQIKTEIAEGRFQVNPEKVADSLIGSVRDLLQSRTARA